MTQVVNIVIVEDEDAAVNRLKKELSKVPNIGFNILATLPSIESSVEWLMANRQPEIIFMDIRLSDGISFEIFKRVKVEAAVIFTTAYDEYAIAAFKVNGLDYLLKPVDPKELVNAMDRFLAQSRVERNTQLEQLIQLASGLKPESYRSSFLVSFRHKMILIDVKDVAYMYVKERAVFLKKKDQKEYLLEFFLDDLEKQLDPTLFYRANRQYLVARSAIVEIEPYFTGRLILNVRPDPPAPIIVSKEKATDFKRWADY